MEGSFFEFRPVEFRGDVAIVAPSSPFDRLHFNAGITELKLNKMRPVIDKLIFSHENFLAGSDSIRSEIILKAFADPKIEAVWTARGGYGSIRLLEHFEKNIDTIKKNPKLFIGFSDVTAIHSWLIEKCGFVTVHGPNITTLDTIDKYSKTQVFELVTGKDRAFSIFNKNIRQIVGGVARGKVKGGNLTTLVSMIGTPFEPDLSGSILFLEDVGEVPYRIDRMITQMRLAGKFKGVKAVILGDFSYKEYRPPADKFVNPYDIVSSMKLEKDVPVIANFPSGHGSSNMAFLLGATAELNTENRTLKYIFS